MKIRDFRLAAALADPAAVVFTPGSAAVALGIGATTAIFSVVAAVVSQPLPFDDPARSFVSTRRAAEKTGHPPLQLRGHARRQPFLRGNGGVILVRSSRGWT